MAPSSVLVLIAIGGWALGMSHNMIVTLGEDYATVLVANLVAAIMYVRIHPRVAQEG